MTIDVFQVIPDHKMGGMQQIAYELDRHLPEHGVRSTVWPLRVAVSVETGSRRGVRLLRSWAKLVVRLRREKPDAVIAHAVVGAWFVFPAALLAGVSRRVLVLHSVWHELGARRSTAAVLLPACGLATDVVYCGQSVGRSFSRVRPLLRGCDTVIQNGVATARAPVAGREGAAAGDSTTFVIAGRLVPGKNVEVLLRALAFVSPRGRLVIYGDGPERAVLNDLATRLGVHVTFAGRVTRENLFAAYQSAGVYLAPSLREGLPLGLIEAAASGLPVIAADLPFNREIMGEHAVYVSPTDVASWSAALEYALDHPDDMRAYARDARDAVQHFSVERMTSEYATLLVRPRRPGRRAASRKTKRPFRTTRFAKPGLPPKG